MFGLKRSYLYRRLPSIPVTDPLKMSKLAVIHLNLNYRCNKLWAAKINSSVVFQDMQASVIDMP
jgi:hypothetical protein